MTRPAPTVTDHPSALVSVPETVIAACEGEQEHFEDWAKSSRYDMSEHPLHYIFMDPKTDAARMGWNAALAYVRNNTAAPAAPQAAGVGEADLLKRAATWMDLRRFHPIDGQELIADVRAASLRAPSREPEGGAVDWSYDLTICPRSEPFLIAYADGDVRMGHYLDNSKSSVPWEGIRPLFGAERWDAKIVAWAKRPALATREEAPVDAGELRGLREAHAEWDAGRLDAEDLAYKVGPALKALRAQPQAREDAQPVGICDGVEQPAFEEWAAKQGFDMNEHPLHYLFLDAKTDAARQAWKAGLEHAVGRMATHPAPDALRVAEKALEPFARFAENVDSQGWTSNIHRERISVWFGPSDFRCAAKALAALQAEQKGGA